MKSKKDEFTNFVKGWIEKLVKKQEEEIYNNIRPRKEFTQNIVAKPNDRFLNLRKEGKMHSYRLKSICFFSTPFDYF